MQLGFSQQENNTCLGTLKNGSERDQERKVKSYAQSLQSDILGVAASNRFLQTSWNFLHNHHAEEIKLGLGQGIPRLRSRESLYIRSCKQLQRKFDSSGKATL
jgi:hypothetical protein